MLLKALIIGCGNMGVLNDCKGSGLEHKTISYAKALKHFEIETYFHDVDDKKVDRAIELWGGHKAKNEDNYDIVIIATPDYSHFGDLMCATGHNPKLVICEKPLCESVEQAERVIKWYEMMDVPILVDYTRRFIPELIDLKMKYKAGVFGEIVDYYISYNRGSLHTGTHASDFINWFFDGDLSSEIVLNEVQCDYRTWQIQLFFERNYWQEQIISGMPVPSYYDNHTMHVIENALNFLDGKEQLKCTMYDALKALKMIK